MWLLYLFKIDNHSLIFRGVGFWYSIQVRDERATDFDGRVQDKMLDLSFKIK